MKNISFLVVFLLLVSCSNNKAIYWCGDHPCINKKEKEAYFKKTMTVEKRYTNKKSLTNNSEIEKIMQTAKKDEKKRINEEKSLAKQAKLEMKRNRKTVFLRI